MSSDWSSGSLAGKSVISVCIYAEGERRKLMSGGSQQLETYGPSYHDLARAAVSAGGGGCPQVT